MEDKPKAEPKKGKRRENTCFICYLIGHKRKYCNTDMEKLDEEEKYRCSNRIKSEEN